ncbi:MAG: hypothetical protein K6G10_01350 [Butyrivibrio sp.]|nr:hypothetical protein [Butyrivibrio sp.]
MAAGKTSRPKANMLFGLDNISGQTRNFADVAVQTEGNPVHDVMPEPTIEYKNITVQKIEAQNTTETQPSVEDEIMAHKRKAGRPKIDGDFQMITARLTKENYIKVKKNCGIYGGITGYINHLIEQV